MNKIILTKGLPASGKTTWARNYMKERVEKGEKWKRINKDDLRNMLDSGEWSKGNEQFVLGVRDFIIAKALGDGYNIIVDDTNLHRKHEIHIREIASGQGAEVEIKDFTHVDPITCIERDLNRPRSVGKKVIMEMYNHFLKPTPAKIPYNPNLKDCYIFDIDGTLAINNSRGPYEWSKVGEDLPNSPVVEVQKLLSKQYDILIFTGRDSVCKEETKKWLRDNEIYYNKLVMRPEGDSRKDSVVKEEMYNEHIKYKYNVKAIYDDRQQVVDMWRDLGLTVFQVDKGDF